MISKIKELIFSGQTDKLRVALFKWSIIGVIVFKFKIVDSGFKWSGLTIEKKDVVQLYFLLKLAIGYLLLSFIIAATVELFDWLLKNVNSELDQDSPPSKKDDASKEDDAEKKTVDIEKKDQEHLTYLKKVAVIRFRNRLLTWRGWSIVIHLVLSYISPIVVGAYGLFVM